MRRRLPLPVLALASLFSAAEAEALFESKLRKANGQPAARYTVAVVGQPLTSICDDDGRFVFDPSPHTPFSIVAVSPSGEVAPPIEVTEPGVAELRIPDAVRETVTVITGVAPTLDTLAGSAAVVLTREEIEQRAPQRLYQTLESVAGGSKLGEGADSVPALRNLARGRTLLMIDGARVTAERRAGPSATYLEPSSLSSVEVMRGPGSVAYGSDAFGGVLNAVTLDPEPDGAGFRYDLESGFAALPENAAFAAGSMARAGHGVLLELHGREADDAEAGGGEEISNSSHSTWGGALRYTHDSRAGRLRLGLALDRVDDLGKAAIDSRGIRAVYPLERSDRLTASWLGAPREDWDTSEATLLVDRYRVVLDRDRAPTPTSNRRIDSSDTDAKDGSLRLLAGRPALGGRLQLGFDVASRFDLEAIVSQTRYAADGTTVVAVDAAHAIADASQIDGGLFATWTRPLAPRWTLAAGARGDEIRTENRGGYFGDRSVRRGALSGNLSISGGPFAGWTTTLQAARGFRSPTLSDRYFRGPSGRGFVTGNPDLDPETSLQWDLSSRWSRTDAAFGAFLYRYRIDDLIERYGSGADFFFRNRGTAILEGIELEAQWTPAAAWTLAAGAAAGRGRTDGGAAIDDIAAPNGWLTARRSIGRGFVVGRVFGALALRRPGPTELGRPGYGLIDVGGGWRMSDRLELRAIVRNAADRRYVGAGDNAADYAPGRSVTLSLSGRL